MFIGYLINIISDVRKIKLEDMMKGFTRSLESFPLPGPFPDNEKYQK
jgi:hypothetical protein